MVAAPLFVGEMFMLLPALIHPGGRLYGLIAGLVTLSVLVYFGRTFLVAPGNHLQSQRQHGYAHRARHGRGPGCIRWRWCGRGSSVPMLAQHAYFGRGGDHRADQPLASCSRSVHAAKTSQAIKRLIGLQPRTARVVRDGKEIDIPMKKWA